MTSGDKSKTQKFKNMKVRNGKVVPVCTVKIYEWSRCSAPSNMTLNEGDW
jgi:hypothetical protein